MLTDKKIKAAKATDKARRLVDGQGLFLHVTPAGGKHWRMRYEIKGREKLLTLGSYPKMTLLAARGERDKAKEALRQHRDPSLDKKLRRAAAAGDETAAFESVARAWHKKSRPFWTERHADDVIHSLERDVFPAVGKFPITELTAPIVLTVLQEIERRKAIETAHRVRQRMSAVFVHAIASGLAKEDPAAIVQAALQPIQRGRQPAITDLEEARQILRDVEAQAAHPITTLAMRLLALTAVRPGELRAAEWAEFSALDGEAPLWTIPADRMKMRREHLVPLSRQAVAVIEKLRPLSGRGQLLFPNVRRHRVPMSENALGYLLNRAGYHSRHVPHGWRATFSTVMNERFRQDRAVIDVMLAHVPKDKVEGAYNRALYLERRRELAQAWAELLFE